MSNVKKEEKLVTQQMFTRLEPEQKQRNRAVKTLVQPPEGKG